VGIEVEGATPAPITEHAFVPEADWWTRCAMCGLPEAAHLTTTVCAACGGTGAAMPADRFGNYDPCPVCEGEGVRP
jgi:DnaJ-class molecular chaperone